MYEATSSLAPEALGFFLLSVLLNRHRLLRVLQRCLPGSLKVNYLTYLFDVLTVGPALASLMAILVTVPLITHWGLLEKSIFDSWPTWLTLLVALFVGDLTGYFRHRLEHLKWLWPIHVMHHSDRDMTWFTLYRFHPLNRLTTVLIDTSLLMATGFPIMGHLGQPSD